ncbi:MAG: hypothetical protein IKV72_07565, partial [Firmicutes bacterium]|nr:hypothetical protein [Bacillota bacterium]
VNLAISLALEGKAVTLVDCDLRNPSDAEILDVDTKQGLIDYLQGKAEFKDCIFQMANGGDLNKRFNFFLVPGGKPVADGSNLLGTGRMKRLSKLQAKLLTM